MVRLINSLLVLVLLLGLTGCKKKEQVVETVEIEEPEEVVVIMPTFKEQVTEFLDILCMKDWNILAETTPIDVKSLSQLIYGEDISVKEVTYNSNTGNVVAVLDCGEHQVLVNGMLDEQGKPEEISAADYTYSFEMEETSKYYEIPINVGKIPSLSGVATIPKGKTDAPVAILMLDDLKANDDEYRRDLAHGLAERGIASVRYNYRSYQQEEVLNTSLDEMFMQDFAYAVHHLETLPVNARSIIYIGSGFMGTLGYYAVNSHFEITGGLVLLNAPFTKTGAELMSRVYWVEEPEDLEGDPSDLPTPLWEDWNHAGALKYTPKVAIPILILQGEADVLSSVDDYDKWRTQKGSNVTMKSYEDLGHEFRDEDWNISESVLDDIRDWVNGKDINKKKKS